MKKLIEFNNEQFESLNEICRNIGISPTEGVRKSVDLFIVKNKSKPIKMFGAWKDKVEDGLTYQKELRNEW